MDLWIALGIFLLGAGFGALTTVALYVKQIRQLKELLEAAHNNSRTEEHSQTGRAQVRLASEVSDRGRTNTIHQPSEETDSLG